jgi:hypothetical protein
MENSFVEVEEGVGEDEENYTDSSATKKINIESVVTKTI